MRQVCRLLLIPLILPFTLSFQGKDEYKFKWGLAKDEYAFYEVTSGKVKSKFVIFGSELTEHGTNRLLGLTGKDIVYRMLFVLPSEPLKVGESWEVEKRLFEALGTKLTAKGNYTFRRIIKNEQKKTALIEVNLEITEVMWDFGGKNPSSPRKAGTINANLYFAITEIEQPKVETSKDSGTVRKAKSNKYFKTIKVLLDKADIVINAASTDLADWLFFKSRILMDAKEEFSLELKEVNAQKENDPGFKQAVEEAIERGVKFLKSKQLDDDGFIDSGFAGVFKTGVTSLVIMALLHSGVKVDDPAIQRGFKYIVNDFKKNSNRWVYDVSLLIMALETKYLPLEKYEQMANFTEQEAKQIIRKNISKDDFDLVKEAAQWLINNQTKEGTWGYPQRNDLYDHSNTQYALLALKSASRCSIEISDSVWRRSADHFIRLQIFSEDEEDVELKISYFNEKKKAVKKGQTTPALKVKPGFWGYFIKRNEEIEEKKQMKKVVEKFMKDVGINRSFLEGYSSMTCAGLTSLLICESELYQKGRLDNDVKQKIEKAKLSGLAWLQMYFTARDNIINKGLYVLEEKLYYLFSLERVGILFGIRKFKDHDWYFEGAMILLTSQAEDGSWVFNHPFLHATSMPIVDTAFALLFLKKATLQVATPK